MASAGYGFVGVAQINPRITSQFFIVQISWENQRVNTIDLVGVLGGVSGFIGALAGVGALYLAWKANVNSARSESLAVDANDLSARSNSIALDAKKLAKEANQISLRTEERDTESNIVSWNYTWEATTCRITNTGSDTALDVVVSVSVDGESLRTPKQDIEPSGSFTISFPELRRKLRKLETDYDEQDRKTYERLQNEQLGNAAFVPAIRLPLIADVIGAIKWATPLGRQREHNFSQPNYHFRL